MLYEVITDSYQREDKIEFLPDEPYTNATGIITFRGNNYRDNAAFGVASVSQQKLTQAWVVESGELTRSDVGGPRNNFV